MIETWRIDSNNRCKQNSVQDIVSEEMNLDAMKAEIDKARYEEDVSWYHKGLRL